MIINALQAERECLISLASPKKPALSQRLAVIVNKIGRQEQSHAFFVSKNVWGAPVSSRPASVAHLYPMARLSGNTLALGDTIACG